MANFSHSEGVKGPKGAKRRREPRVGEEAKGIKNVEAEQVLQGEAVVEEVAVVGAPQKPARPQRGFQGKGEPSEFTEKVVSINRITKVNKGGKKLSFSALVVVGDGKGRVGYCLDKAGEVAIAIRKALVGAKKGMITVPMRGTTIPHQIIGECGSAKVLLKPASEGTGIIAAGPVRAVCSSVGIQNILSKCHRSNNPINVVKATIDGLSRLKVRKEPAKV